MLPALVDHHHRIGRRLDDLAEALLEPLARGDVDDGRQHHRALVGLDRIQADFDRELAAVLLQAEQIATGAHRPRVRIDEERAAQAPDDCRESAPAPAFRSACPSISARAKPNTRSACAFTISMMPRWLIITIAFGADSTTWRNRSSLLRSATAICSTSGVDGKRGRRSSGFDILGSISALRWRRNSPRRSRAPSAVRGGTVSLDRGADPLSSTTRLSFERAVTGAY